MRTGLECNREGCSYRRGTNSHGGNDGSCMGVLRIASTYRGAVCSACKPTTAARTQGSGYGGDSKVRGPAYRAAMSSLQIPVALEGPGLPRRGLPCTCHRKAKNLEALSLEHNRLAARSHMG